MKILRADETQENSVTVPSRFFVSNLLPKTVKIKKLNNLRPTEKVVTGNWRKLYTEERQDV
jgi:hypothetical protein